MNGRRHVWILITVGVATLLSSMSNSVTNTVLPVVARDLRLNVVASAWVTLIYLLVLIVLLLPAGRLADLVNRRALMTGGFVVFGLGSMEAALSHTLAGLLAARAVTAVAGAVLLSTGPAVLTATFPRDQRGRALGWQALMTYFGLAVGPILGGWLAQASGWPAVFWVAVPIAAVGAGMAVVWIPGATAPVRAFDTFGSVTFMVLMIALTLLMNPSAYAHQAIGGAAVLTALVLVSAPLFVRRQSRFRDPLMDLRLFRARDYLYGTLGAMINYLCFFVCLFLVPFYLATVRDWPVGRIGLVLTVMPALMMVLAPWAGSLSDRLGSRGLSTVGMLANTLGLVACAVAAAWGVLWLPFLIGGLVLMGAGTGLFAAPNNAAIMKAAPADKQGVASGTLATARYVGMVAGTTLGSSAFHALKEAASGAHPFSTAFVWVMVIGAAFGVAGCFVTRSMQGRTQREAKAV